MSFELQLEDLKVPVGWLNQKLVRTYNRKLSI